jgi:glycerol-3-phosphate cytidylyltransferase
MSNVYEQFRAARMDKRIGVTASCFDLMHAGHVLMLQEGKSLVDVFVVFLQTDPTVDRPSKNKPILSMDERRILVQGCKYVDHIFEYTTEAELLEGLRSLRPDLRILGDDYVGKSFTGSDLNIPVHFHNRSVHGWSTSALRKKIWEEEGNQIRLKVVDSLRSQFIADRSATFMELKGVEQGRVEFDAWYESVRDAVEVVLQTIAAEFIVGGGTTSDVSIFDYDLYKYGIADPI